MKLTLYGRSVLAELHWRPHKRAKFETAKQVLEQANKEGVAGDKLGKLESQLFPQIQTNNVNSTKLPQAIDKPPFRHYHNGRLEEAEKLALSITQDFPEHQFAWKVLGAVMREQEERLKLQMLVRQQLCYLHRMLLPITIQGVSFASRNWQIR